MGPWVTLASAVTRDSLEYGKTAVACVRSRPIITASEAATMRKKYIVELRAQDRQRCLELICAGTAHTRTVMHARVLLKADSGPEGPGWTDAAIAEAVEVSTVTVAKVRQRFASEGMELTLEHYRGPNREYPCKLDGRQEAYLLALALDLRQLHSPELLPPAVDGALRDAVLPGGLGDRAPALDLPQDAYDLLLAVARALHERTLLHVPILHDPLTATGPILRGKVRLAQDVGKSKRSAIRGEGACGSNGEVILHVSDCSAHAATPPI